MWASPCEKQEDVQKHSNGLVGDVCETRKEPAHNNTNTWGWRRGALHVEDPNGDVNQQRFPCWLMTWIPQWNYTSCPRSSIFNQAPPPSPEYSFPVGLNASDPENLRKKVHVWKQLTSAKPKVFFTNNSYYIQQRKKSANPEKPERVTRPDSVIQTVDSEYSARDQRFKCSIYSSIKKSWVLECHRSTNVEVQEWVCHFNSRGVFHNHGNSISSSGDTVPSPRLTDSST